MNIDIPCPMAREQSNMLSNYGDFVAGYGLERIEGQGDFPIYFKSNTSGKNLSANLNDYYSCTTGEVTCHYSGMAQNLPFKVIYTLANGKGGKAVAEGPDRINILVPFAYK
jgi:hypothetical protein